jgi:alpha-ketoglutarate-dependent 2,4-dichlorophenoxyacetate dioxygenase
MSVSIRQIHPAFVGEVAGIDLRETVDPEDVAAIEEGMDRYAVLIFHDQPVTDEQQIAFTRNFGTIEPAVGNSVTDCQGRRLSTDMADLSNLESDDRIFAPDDRRRLFDVANRLWHSDSSFRVVPAKYSLLSARAIPTKGGNTEFADMRAAYDALDDAARAEVAELVCEHSLLYSRSLLGFTEFTAEEKATFAPVRQRLVRTHPVTGRKSLYLSSHAGTILGSPMPDARAYLRDLSEHATQSDFVHVHEWRLHDLVIWDNRQTMHRVRRYNDANEIRDMRRTTIVGDAPTVT